MSFPSALAIDPRALNVKQNIFEHFIFPYKLNPQLLSQWNSPFITMEQFKEVASKQLPGMDAEILFTFLQLALESQPVIERKPVEVKQLSLFLSLQSFNQAGRHSIFENININDVKYQERQRQTMQSYSPLNSPRAKTMRVQSQQSEVHSIIQYVKSSVKEWIQLLATNTDTISSQEFNLLQLLLFNEQKSLSQVIFDRTTKLGKDIVAEWTIKNIQCPESVSVISGFTKSVTIKSNVGEDLKITQCDDSMIYVDCAINTLSISQCTNCQIFVSAVRMITSITSCEKTTICVASNYIKICNTIDSVIHYYGSYAPIIYGDCRSIVLSPNNSNTEKTLQHLRDAQIPINRLCRDRYMKPIIMGGNRIDWSLQSMDEFSKFTLPEQHFGCIDSGLIVDCNFDIDRMAKEITDKRILSQPMNFERIVLPLLAPPEYIKIVFERYQLFAGMQAQIKQAGLRDESARLLQHAIQGNFREWLVSTGQIKGISDLVKLIDQDQ